MVLQKICFTFCLPYGGKPELGTGSLAVRRYKGKSCREMGVSLTKDPKNVVCTCILHALVMPSSSAYFMHAPGIASFLLNKLFKPNLPKKNPSGSRTHSNDPGPLLAPRRPPSLPSEKASSITTKRSPPLRWKRLSSSLSPLERTRLLWTLGSAKSE